MENQHHNKLFEILQSLFSPRHMTRLTSIGPFVSILILFFAGMFCIFSSKVSAKALAGTDLHLPTTLQNIPEVVEFSPGLPSVSFDKETSEFKISEYGTFEGSYITESNETVNITIVFEESDEEYNFDLTGYLKQELETNETKVLYIITPHYIYHVYNMLINSGFNSSHYVTNEQGDYLYYLPKENSEIAVNEYGHVDTRLWTKLVLADSTIDFEISDPNINKEELKPVNKLNDNLIYALYGQFDNGSVITSVGFDISTLNSSFKEFNASFVNGYLQVGANTYSSAVLLLAVITNMLFPLLLSFFAFLISHKTGELKKFREYLALSAICFLDAGIIAAIIGFFIHYLKTWIFLTIAASLFYIICAALINREPKEKDKPSKKKTIIEEKDYAELG